MSEWKYMTLDKMGVVARGKSKHRPRNDARLFGGKYPFIQTGDIGAAGLYVTSYSQTYNEEGLAQSKLWDKDTLCITIAANIADTALLAFPACFPDSIMGFIPKKDVSNVRFVKYCFDILKKYCQQISKGTTQDNLSWKKLSTIKFPCPPIEIQNSIATILSRYDSLIENYQKQIKLLEEAAQRLYKEWFVDLHFPGHENTKIVDGVPEGWEKKKVREIGKVITGKTPSTAKKEYYGGQIPFITIPDMHTGIYPTSSQFLSDLGANSQSGKFIPANSLMVSCIGTAGLVCITKEECQTNQQINSLVLNDNSLLYYMYNTFLSLKEHLYNIGSNGATMTNVNKSKFESIEILIPNNSISNLYNKAVEQSFRGIKTLSSQIRLLTEARDRLLPKLMSGEIAV